MAITLANLRSRARQRADMENSTFVADAEANVWLNDGYKRLWHKVAEKLGERLISATPTQFTISSGNTQAVASDFFKLWGVDYQISSGRWAPLDSWMPMERNQSRYRQVSNFYERIRYRLLGNTLYFTPDDDALGTYRYWYIPTVTELSGDSSEINSEFERTGWYEFIYLYAAKKMLAKEESDTGEIRLEMAEITNAIDQEALNRDIAMPQRIQDVQYLDYDDPYIPRF